ncbi:hypothetical protein A4R43_36635 [Amycolatopsis albispora]|uniref:Glycosyl transferase n=2 Tax=Amycolatopsis albispora TaxID=1804986 RepID=A0A344LGX4_9PSEU|nr:hypothetical protein A4R43_36635 [Amycolatopsis albispora]
MTELADRGHATWFDTAMPDAVRDGEADVIVAQRTCLPGPSAVFQRMARENHARMVYEIDDDLFAVDPSNRHAHQFFGLNISAHTRVGLDGSLERTPYFDDGLRARMIENIRVAHMVTVTTEPLADVVSQWNDNVVVLPNQVPAWLLDHERPTAGDLVTVGWRGGDSHGRDFGELAKPLRGFLQRPASRGQVEFHAMGADYTPRVASRHVRTRHTAWTAGVADFLKKVDFDLAVVPLRDTRFNQSKSDLAVLEMAALGIPAITSDAGPYATVHGGPNIPCSTSAQWTAALAELVENPEYRVQLGKQAREWAASRTIEGNAHLWEEAYEQ